MIPKETPEDKIAYDQLKALNHYNKPAGRAVLLMLFLLFSIVLLEDAAS